MRRVSVRSGRRQNVGENFASFAGTFHWHLPLASFAGTFHWRDSFLTFSTLRSRVGNFEPLEPKEPYQRLFLQTDHCDSRLVSHWELLPFWQFLDLISYTLFQFQERENCVHQPGGEVAGEMLAREVLAGEVPARVWREKKFHREMFSSRKPRAPSRQLTFLTNLFAL